MANVSLETSKDQVDLFFIKEMSAASWPQFQWLEWLFNHTGNPESTFVAILDNVEGRLTEPRIFKASKEVDGSENLASALGHHPLEIATHIVVLVHDTHDVDRCALETLCSVYNIDPLFLMSHFYWDHEIHKKDESETGFDAPPEICAPISLPSIVTFLS